MSKKLREAQYEAMGRREGVSKRIIEIAKQIVERGSYKRAVVGVGQMSVLADLCKVDSYWDEKMSYGRIIELDIVNGIEKCEVDENGKIDWDTVESLRQA